ncbi:hypothetical protein [Candidatus Protochlamydia phocaeensis]|uniref:hypothetical protein n=1 Tax=Candidatus Protochlamydia phocaeensis TaxID=1414722 RepID=UPI000837DFC9|nr:hypothetical protein [Candidatus Protochlamydia phocaeensis]
MNIPSYQLSSIENFSCTAHVTKPLSNLNQSGGLLISRILSCAIVPLTAIADGAIHMSLFVLKGTTGAFFTPYNLVMVKISPKWTVPRDLELSSAFIHLMRVVECLFTAAILPFICLINPTRAYDFMSHRYGLHEKDRQKHVDHLDQRVVDLDRQLRESEAQVSDFRAQLMSVAGAEVARKALEQQLAALRKENEQLKNIGASPIKGSPSQETDPSIGNPSTPIKPIPTPPTPPKNIPTPPKNMPPPPPPPKNFKPMDPSSSDSNSSNPQPTEQIGDLLTSIHQFSKDNLKRINSSTASLQNSSVENQTEKQAIVLCAKHQSILNARRGPSLYNLKECVEEDILTYLADPEEGDSIEEIEDGGWCVEAFASFLQEYCQNVNIPFSSLKEKPFTITEENLENARSYFDYFLKQIEAKREEECLARRKAEPKEEDNKTAEDKKTVDTPQPSIVHPTPSSPVTPKILEAEQKLAKKKEFALTSLSFLKEIDIETKVSSMKRIQQMSLKGTIFASNNQKLSPSFASYEEFIEKHKELVASIQSANSEEAIEQLKQQHLFQRVAQLVGFISLEFRE